jgi:hypothetical protein
MFIVEGRTLGVFAALGVVLSMVVVFDRLSDVADSTEPGPPAAFTMARAAPLPAMYHEGELAPPLAGCLDTRASAADCSDDPILAGGSGRAR